MTIDQRVEIFAELGKRLSSLKEEDFNQLAHQSHIKNAWFTENNIRLAFDSLAQALDAEKLKKWTLEYQLAPVKTKDIGIVMAGNIPMVGFHDLLSVIISGHRAVVKMSSQDETLMEFIISQLHHINPDISDQISIVERLDKIDAVIATGSDNTSRYFEYYFRKYPHIIRKNRTSIAILNGNENEDELKLLAHDVYSYFGMGCRNVSKLYLPKNYNMVRLLDLWQDYAVILDHHKYRNNYDYHKSILLVNQEEHLDTGFSLFKESNDLVSPLSITYYEFYDDVNRLHRELDLLSNKIQCIVSTQEDNGNVPPGKAQQPELWDYADGVDTLTFLDGL